MSGAGRRVSTSCRQARSGRRHQSELAEQLGLIEVEVFRGQLVAANLITRHPAEVDVPSRGRDIARRRAHDTGVRAYEPALGGDDGSFGEKARRLETPVRKRVPEHTEEGKDLLAAVHRRVRCDEVGVVAPRTGFRVPCVERLDMPFDDALGISHQTVPPVGCRAPDTPTLPAQRRGRRGRDSNPRWSVSPHTRLAGECLQPLGHLSGTRRL